MRRLKDHLAGKKHVIWDWNGTLLDDLDLTVAIVADTAEAHVGRRLTRDEYLKLMRFPVKAYYEDIGFDFAKVSFEELSVDFTRRYGDGVRTCLLFDGTHELLTELRADNVQCSILTAAPEDSVLELLAHFGIAHFFHTVFGLKDIYARSKIERGRQLMAHLGLPPEELVLVGDTDHDYEVAQAMGIDAILLTAGHQCQTRLELVHNRVVAR